MGEGGGGAAPSDRRGPRAGARRVWLVGAVSLGLLAACQAIVGLERAIPAAAGDSGGPEASVVDAPSDAGCQHALPPGPPELDAFADAGGTPFYVALDSLSAAHENFPAGYDLDGLCTCPDPPGCVGHANVPTQVCDGPGGRDLAANAFMSQFEQILSFRNQTFTARAAAGKLSLLLEIRDYSGDRNDSDVSVWTYVSAGIVVDDAGTIQPPRWDGTDPWCPASEEMLSERPEYVSQHRSRKGYVRDGVLVALLPDVSIGFGLGALRLDGVILSGTLLQEGNSYRVGDGQIAGRITTLAALTLLSVVPGVEAGQTLCGTNGQFVPIREQLCQAADLQHAGAVPNPNASCDALSIGFTFTARPATVGPPAHTKYVPPGCDGSIDDCSF